jgi:hypothetical protein
MRFLLQWVAKFRVSRTPEIGGLLYDYANGRWKLLTEWQGGEDEEAVALIENIFNNPKDDIYVSLVKCTNTAGYFIVSDSERRIWLRHFWGDTYPFAAAFDDTRLYCRKIAKEMGYRDLEER